MLSPTSSPFFAVWSARCYSQYWNWPSLVSTARSPVIPWILWSHKPSHFVICDHKSDASKSVTHVNKAYLVWLMFWVLSNQHNSTAPIRSCVRGRTQFFKTVGLRASVSFFPLPIPRYFFFFYSRPDVVDELARKRLLRRLDVHVLL